MDESQYDLVVSTDGGGTFNNTVVCLYDRGEVVNRIVYLGKGQIVLAVGWKGAYFSDDSGKTIKKLDSVFYYKTIGYGAAEKKGGVNKLFMYGR